VTKAAEIRISANEIAVRRDAGSRVAVVGSPNSGKSTVFNRLTGLKQRIGNYPGVTVERHIGTLSFEGRKTELIDLPGTHSLSAHSLEEQITVDVILGRMEGSSPPDGILAVLDATNLYQGLFLVQQLVELQVPTVVALTMTDAATLSGINIDLDALSHALGGVRICPVVGDHRCRPGGPESGNIDARRCAGFAQHLSMARVDDGRPAVTHDIERRIVRH